MPSIGTYYYDGVSFADATAIYTNATLTSLAPDGWYMVGNIFRQQISGVLGAPTNCPSCAVPCGTGGFVATGTTGVYNVLFQLGNTPGASIITFSPGINQSSCQPIPDKLTWTYNGVSASEYSSLVGGYQTGMIGAPDGPPKPGTQCSACVETGIPTVLNVTNFNYDLATSSFVPGGAVTIPAQTGLTNAPAGQDPECTLLAWNNPNLSNQFSSGPCPNTNGISQPVSFSGTQPAAPNLPFGGNWPAVNGEYRGATMVVPSPPGVASTILSITVTAPCTNTWWGITVECPRELAEFQSSALLAQNTPTSTVCAAGLTQKLYHVPVDAYGNTNLNSAYAVSGDQFPLAGKNGQPDGRLGYHDWVYTDKHGVNPAPVGEYKMRFDAGDGAGVRNWHVSIGVRAYKDVNNPGGTCAPNNNQVHALPPEGYAGSYNGVVGSTQTSGAYVPGIVRSIVPCP